MEPEPAPLSTLPPAQLKAIRSNLLAEHFQWSPESFAKSAMDLANVVMYSATEAAETSLAQREDVFDPEEVQAGIYRLETLLESAIDKQFDLYEMFVLRNTFNVPDALIPYIVLAHQESLLHPPTKTDEEALQAYQQEVAAYEAALLNERRLAATKAWTLQQLEDQRTVAHEIGALKASEPLTPLATNLQLQLAQLSSSLLALLSTPHPALSHPIDKEGDRNEAEDPFGGSRAAFVNWAAGAKVGPGGSSGEELLGGAARGKSEDAATLLAQLGGN